MEELREWIEAEELRTGRKGAGGIISVGQWEVGFPLSPSFPFQVPFIDRSPS